MQRKIVLADDHQLLTEGTMRIIAEIPGVEVAAVVENGRQLLQHLRQHATDLVVLDLNMPGQDGLKCLQEIRETTTPVRILVLTSYNQPELVAEVRKLGANGFVVKNVTAAELKEAVTRVLEGHEYFPSPPASPVDAPVYFDSFLKKHQLTRRETDIIRLICAGRSSKQISAELFISEFTVNTHRKNIFRKLGISNVAGLVNFARENQLL
ncbi:MAG TPA: response regulator transcription factor [Chitinophagaceae bacterium]